MLARMSKLTLIELEVPTGDVAGPAPPIHGRSRPSRRNRGGISETRPRIRVAYSIAEILETMEKDLHVQSTCTGVNRSRPPRSGTGRSSRSI
jgi:hypothetical protein